MMNYFKAKVMGQERNLLPLNLFQEVKLLKLVIAEKPSVALTIAKVIGANKKNDGYYEGGGYKISWCIGHLVQMANHQTNNKDK